MNTVDKQVKMFPVSAFQLVLAMIPIAMIWFSWVPSSTPEKESLRRLIPIIPAGIGMICHLWTILVRLSNRSVRATLVSWQVALICYFVAYLIFMVMGLFFPEA